MGLAVVLGTGLVGLLTVVLVLAVLAVVAMATGGTGLLDLPDDAWFVTPWGMLATNLLLAAGIPVAMLAVRVGHRWRPGYVSSVVGRLRWRVLLGSAARAALVLVPALLVTVVVDAAFTGTLGDLTAFDPEPRWAALALVVLLTTPLQAAGEEYFFRGWLTQAIGSWCARPLVALVLPALVSATVFALAHGSQDPWLFADRFAFGLVASVLVWRTGGLEASIAVHTVNNVAAFALAIAYGGLADSLAATEAAPWVVVLDVLAFAGAAFLAARWATRSGVRREVPGGWVGRAGRASPRTPDHQTTTGGRTP
ncbi:lysostaphin resistance A-like protein [Cellulomonas sp. P22]|uniref:lysostaphin resistance A-like protein n=1 Tax=Cellulomonas sp. P22 TaxID=3373189 RepID=UPI0037A42F3B